MQFEINHFVILSVKPIFLDSSYFWKFEYLTPDWLQIKDVQYYSWKQREKNAFLAVFYEKIRKVAFFCQKLTLFHYLPEASDFSQKSLRIVYKKMPDIYFSKFFFQNLIIPIIFGVTSLSNVANEMKHTVDLWAPRCLTDLP